VKRRFVIAGVIAGWLLTMLALPVAGADLTGGCQLEVRSFDAAGAVVDEGNVPGSVGSQDDPFKVEWDGNVDFHFITPRVFQNNHWSVAIESLPVLNGSDDNPLDLDEIGNVTIASKIPVRFVGLIHVTGDIYGNGDADTCHGDGWVLILGDPVGTIPWILAAALIAAGVIGLMVTPYVPWEGAGRDELPGGTPTDA
jgi:hypothetical protein